MSKIVILETIRDINRRIDEDIAFYQKKLDEANLRLGILLVEKQ